MNKYRGICAGIGLAPGGPHVLGFHRWTDEYQGECGIGFRVWRFYLYLGVKYREAGRGET